MPRSVTSLSNTIFFVATLCFLTFGTTACYEESTQETIFPSTLQFSGATAATAISNSMIEVTWSPPTEASLKSAGVTLASFRIYEANTDGSLKTPYLVSPPPTATSYRFIGLTAGEIKNYVVRAIDSNGNEDTNLTVVKAMPYEGIVSADVPATSAGQTQVTVRYTLVPSASQLLLYCSTPSSAYAIIPATLNPASGGSAVVTGLSSGTTYTCLVRPVDQFGTEFPNSKTTTFQTVSKTFGPQILPVSALNYTGTYRGVLNAQAWGEAGDTSWIAPTNQPKARQVTLTWNAFTGATSSTTYKLIRVGQGGTIDTKVTDYCTSSTTASCQVRCPAVAVTGTVLTYDSSGISGTGTKTCTDNNVAASPQKYDYVVTQIIGGVAEETPSTGDSPYRISVPIPPHDMVLVHRDSVNYEICNFMGKSDMSPTDHQRCAYDGLGAAPYRSNTDNAALNLSSNYYDFGYNLFVDRWNAACNWTPAAPLGTGMCGASGVSGNCFGTAAPATTVGAVGNVYYDTVLGTCHVKTGASTWTTMYGSMSQANRALAYTNTPSKDVKKPPLVMVALGNAADTCASISDSTYGPKRLLRRREQIAATAWPTITGEPRAMITSAVSLLEYHTDFNATRGCNTNTHAGVTVSSSFNSSTNEVARSTGAGPASFVIGSDWSRDCVSRYGAQDMIGNVQQFVSDQITGCAGNVCNGIASTADNGNTDFSTLVLNYGGQATAGWAIYAGTYGASYLSVPLGIPLTTTDGGNAIAISTIGPKTQADYFYFTAASPAAQLRTLATGGFWGWGQNGGRFTLNLDNQVGTLNNYLGFRCALPAE